MAEHHFDKVGVVGSSPTGSIFGKGLFRKYGLHK